jgi:hypothetical protein
LFETIASQKRNAIALFSSCMARGKQLLEQLYQI